MEKKVMPPYIGAAYYPEMWSEDEIEKGFYSVKDLNSGEQKKIENFNDLL